MSYGYLIIRRFVGLKPVSYLDFVCVCEKTGNFLIVVTLAEICLHFTSRL